MRYEEFIHRVEARAANGPARERAERAVQATLATLADCLDADAARRLAAQLPRELQALLTTHDGAERLRVGAFLDRVSEHEDLSRSEAFDDVRAVFSVLGDAVTARELAAVRAALPARYATLFGATAVDGWPDARRRLAHAGR
ncbi:MAG TPA: DUF2267 domain-containing protein [Solirubrobacteraceae bacterium]|nr:DUF2267 domain-containing protein [Solirubrobacteraceae bacterium]